MDIKNNIFDDSSLIKKKTNCILKVDDSIFNITIILYENNQISIEANETITKLLYNIKLIPESIIEITQNNIGKLSSDQFYDLFVTGFQNLDKKSFDGNVKLIGVLDKDKELLNLQIFTKSSLSKDKFIERTFILALKYIKKKDVIRMGEMMKDFENTKNVFLEFIKKINNDKDNDCHACICNNCNKQKKLSDAKYKLQEAQIWRLEALNKKMQYGFELLCDNLLNEHDKALIKKKIAIL